jgi:hypothetical protein
VTNLESASSHITQAIICLEKERTVKARRLVDMLKPIVSGANALVKASHKLFFTEATLARKERYSAMEVNARCNPGARHESSLVPNPGEMKIAHQRQSATSRKVSVIDQTAVSAR